VEGVVVVVVVLVVVVVVVVVVVLFCFGKKSRNQKSKKTNKIHNNLIITYIYIYLIVACVFQNLVTKTQNLLIKSLLLIYKDINNFVNFKKIKLLFKLENLFMS
jgi:heme/copper-type cytochrome/quinol oxidase subunit 2